MQRPCSPFSSTTSQKQHPPIDQNTKWIDYWLLRAADDTKVVLPKVQAKEGFASWMSLRSDRLCSPFMTYSGLFSMEMQTSEDPAHELEPSLCERVALT